MGWLDGWRLLTGELQRTRFENDVLRNELAVADQAVKDWKKLADSRERAMHFAAAQTEAALKLAKDLEKKHYLTSPTSWTEHYLTFLEMYLPKAPWTRTDDPLRCLPLAEWQRGVAWVLPIARANPYQKNEADCEDAATISLGRLSEWSASLAKGLVLGTTKSGVYHAWCFVFADDGAGPKLYWFDPTPPDAWTVFPWAADGLCEVLPDGWAVDRLTWL